MAAPNAWNVLLGAPNFSDAATLTASGERTGFPVTNLQVQDPSDRYEVVPTATERIYIQADYGTQAAANGIFLGYTNLTQYASWRIRWADTLAGLTSSPAYDSAPLGPAMRLYTSTSTARTAPTPPPWSGIVDFSIECWFRVQADTTDVGIIRRGLASDDPTIWIDTSGNIVFGDPTDVTEQVTSTTQVVAGTWYHVCGAYSSSGTEIAIIVNGVEEATGTAPGAWSAATHVRVGIAQTERMNGLISNPRFWQKRRTASEVLADYQTLLVGTETDLVAAWQNDDATGVPTEIVAGEDLIPTDIDWAFPERAWSVADYPSWMERHCLHTELSLGFSARYVRIDICDGQNPDGVLRFGRLNIGGWVQPGENAQYGTDLIQWEDTGSFERTVNGASIVVPGTIKRSADFKFATTQESDVSLLSEMHAARGGSYDVLFCADPSRTDSYTHQGLLMGVLQRRSRIRFDGYGLWRSAWTVTEL